MWADDDRGFFLGWGEFGVKCWLLSIKHQWVQCTNLSISISITRQWLHLPWMKHEILILLKLLNYCYSISSEGVTTPHLYLNLLHWWLTLLFPASALVLGRDVDNTISIDVEGDLNLGNSSGGRRYPHQTELTQHFVVCCHLSFSLTHLDFHLRLSISCRWEHLKVNRDWWWFTLVA